VKPCSIGIIYYFYDIILKYIAMKKLILIRHAKSSWDFSGLTDLERPLNKRGKHDAPLMGQVLKTKKIFPDLILSSPALRALNTAVIIAQEIGYNKNIQVNDRIYHAYTPDLWTIVKTLPDKYETVFLFGHNPSFTEFANELTQMQLDNIPTCGIYAVAWQTEKWVQISKKEAEYLFYEYPKKNY
jgi:phosphohistidine phosphatase